MSEIQFTGLSTGIDTGAIVQQLMAIESKRLYKYQADLVEEEKVRSALNALETDLETLRSAAEDLSDASGLRAFQTTSSDADVLTAEASDKAFEANHTIVIDQLANPERWVHSSGLEYAEDYVGAGTFIYSYNGQESIITTAADTTLEELMGLINNDADNPGVTASLLKHNDAYHLVLNGNEAGSDYEISINDSNTEVWQADSPFTVGDEEAGVNTLLTNLDQFSGTLVGDEAITTTGMQHDGTAVSATFTISAHTRLSHLISEIEDAFGGTAIATLENGKIILTDRPNGTSQMTLSLSYDAGSGSTTLTMPTVSQTTAGGSVSAS
ncbi:MAG: flagellar filament capping protein FliD, partial [Planctomycetota bacterium]